MTPEQHRLLVETYELALENNKMLKKIARANTLSIVLKVVYWGLIIGLSFGAYYFIQPYLDTMKASYNSLGSVTDIMSQMEQLR